MSLRLRLRTNRDATPARSTGPAGSVGQAGLATVLGPAAVENTPHYLKVADGYTATLIVTGYPAEVGPAWLDPLLSWPGRLDVVQHIEPLAPPVAAARLRRQRARLESTRRTDAETGRLADPMAEAAAEDAADLADRVARGEAKLFQVGLYLCVHAPSLEELDEAVAHVRATAASVLLDTQPATWRQLQGWITSLPLATDGLGMRRVMDTDALAAAFPLASPDLPAPLPGEPAAAGGVLYGLNPHSNGIAWWDDWDQHNANSVVLARSGAGKSYLVKLKILRSLADDVHVSIIDPDNEYIRLVEAVDGVTLALGSGGVRLNPLDIPPADRRPQARTYRGLFLHTLVAVLLGHQPPPSERAALDSAINAAYNTAGITNDPATWRRPAPLLRDVTDALTAQRTDAATTLAARLAPWVTGSFREMFDGPTTTVPAGQLVCWSTRQLPDELRAAGMLLALDAIWRDVDTPNTRPSHTPRRLVVVDEAWTLLREGEGARFLSKLAKAARKRKAGLAVITQDVGDLLGSDLGQIVIANAATQILLRQAPQVIDVVTDVFALTTGEARQLLAARRGEGLLLSGTHRVAFDVVASPREHRLCIGDLELADDDE
ncbi:VirB4 family type IV secretion system protein [Cryptosporangium minutisporangium]|uniref:VirB4 family type IV secretion system protein n=1 Tax=Cryptosporangium minutisporangium TaxID=113569 RepID=UPI0035EC4803